MGCNLSNNIVYVSNKDVFQEIILDNKYKYLKKCLYKYIDISGRNQRFINQFCGSMRRGDKYENSSLARLSDTGVKSVYDIIELLCYVPLHEMYSGTHLEMQTIFRSYVIQFKKNKIQVHNKDLLIPISYYTTSFNIKWSECCFDKFDLRADSDDYDLYQKHYVKLEFNTICAIIDIVNIECNLFKNEEWISRDFTNIINEFKFVKPHNKLLKKMNEWIYEKYEMYSDIISETTSNIRNLEGQIEDILYHKRLRENNLNSCDYLDYKSVGDLMSRGNDNTDDEIKKLRSKSYNYRNALQVHNKRFECTKKLLGIIVFKEEPVIEEEPVIKEEVAVQVSQSENTNIPIADAVVVNSFKLV
jgi:hypothetical protein